MTVQRSPRTPTGAGTHVHATGGRGTTKQATGLRHEALLYRSDEEFLAGAVSLIEEGIEAGDPVMVAVSEPKIELLRESLGAAADAVEFADMTQIGRNPTRLISVWRDFVDTHRNTPRLHGIGETVWVGRDADELAECGHHEALLNRAFAGGPSFRLRCLYDASGLDGHVLSHALHNHPWVVDATGTRPSEAYLEPELMPDPLADPLADPPPGAELIFFTSDAELPRIRAFARARAAAAELDERRATDIAFALNELVTNSLVHGGGGGEFLAWERPGAMAFEVRDRGRIPDALLGRARPDVMQEQGRGLWLVNELCDLVQVRSGPEGTRVRLWIRTD